MEDVFDAPDVASNNSTMQRMVSMMKEVVETETLVKELETNLVGLKSNLNLMKTQTLPDLMAEVGVSEFVLDETGVRLIVDDFVHGSLPKEPDKREKAIKWLTDHDGADMLRTEVLVEFDKNEHNMALSFIAECEERDLDPEVKTGVHPQTYVAHMRERLRNGEEVPLEMLGLFAGRVVKVKPPKEPTKKRASKKGGGNA